MKRYIVIVTMDGHDHDAVGEALTAEELSVMLPDLLNNWGDLRIEEEPAWWDRED